MNHYLKEMRFYKWAIRGIFLVLLGGSIFGITKYEDYIDSRIANRFEHMDNMYYAVSLANSSEWRDSLTEFDVLLNDLKASKAKLSAQSKTFLFRNLLWVLSYIEGDMPDGTPIGQHQWNILNTDSDFLREFKTSQQFSNNEAVNHNFARATLKYDSSPDVLAKARGYYVKAKEAATRSENKATITYCLAFFDLIEGKSDQALTGVMEAESLDPSNYKIENILLNRDAIMKEYYFVIIARIAKKHHSFDFAKAYNDLMDELATKNAIKQPQRKSRK